MTKLSELKYKKHLYDLKLKKKLHWFIYISYSITIMLDHLHHIR
jgi:hypothetical protein